MYKIGLCFLLNITEAGDLKEFFFSLLASLLAEAYRIDLCFFCKLQLNKVLHMDARNAYWVLKQIYIYIFFFFVVSIFWVLSLRVVKGSTFAFVINYHKSWQIWVSRNTGFVQMAYLCALCNDEERGTCQPENKCYCCK